MECRICGNRYVITKGLQTETIDICFKCGYGRPSGRVPIKYDESYEKKYLSYPEKELCEIRLNAIKKTLMLIRLINNPRRLLDYGCGSGAFVEAAREAGYHAYGYDVNDFTAHLRPHEGFQPGIITAWDSFEHLTDEEQIEFFKLSKNADVVVLSVPNFDSANRAGGIESWRHYRPNEHLHYYTRKALNKKFSDEGFQEHYYSYAEDAIRKAPWENNILTMGFIRKYE